MKQKLYLGLVLNLSLLSLGNIINQASATEQPEQTEFPAITVKQWRLPKGYAARAQLNNSAIIITNVELQPTATGVELAINTVDGKRLRRVKYSQGNSVVIDFANAQLQLAEPSFVRKNPATGISQVKAIALPGNRVRVIISGTEGLPTSKIITSNGGLIVNATPPLPVADVQTQPDQVIDVIVTAEKKPERLQDVPISITSIGEQEAEDANIDSFRDISENTPNFTTYTPSRNFVTYSVRGFSNFNFISRDSVAFYIDDVPYDYTNFLGLNVYPIERVEVLRGAQATLYGRNAQAGVVNIITKPPAEELEFDGGISYGNFNSYELQASVSSPIVKDKLTFRLSGRYNNRDGFTENTFLDRDIDSQSGLTARGKLLWTPTEDLKVAFNASVDDYNDGAQPFVALDAEDPFEIEQEFDGFTNVNTDTQSVRVDYKHDAFRLTSISARRFSSSDFEADVDIFSPPTDNTAIQVFDVDSDSLSQEIRFQSPNQKSRFQWLAGSYLEFRDFEVNDSSFITDAGITLTEAEIDENTLAFFGQVSYKPVEPLTLTAGLRYESFDSTLNNRTISDFTGFGRTVTSFNDIEQDDDIVLPRFVAQYRFNPNLMTYASIARGYKPAGVNYFADVEELLTFDTETSTNYEIGLKSSFLKDRLKLNLAAFYSPVNDFQINALDVNSFARQVANVDADIAGVEVEVKAILFKGFEAIAGFGYVNATFEDFSNPFGNEELEDNNLPYVPDYTYNLALQYRADFGLFTRLELQGVGTSFFDNPNEFKRDPYTLVNARIGYEQKNYGIYFFANNIFDTEYLTTAFDFGSLGQIASFGNPATYGVQVKTKF
ncbi:TonB-dependent receptor domain-containing protein [Pleurocapsa sp. PCC 7319]|uniref:TonB-dependent receptor domain-containing protein n=1 Tax=Pleurocapsa sp. PCC 7319 TaxID=118161 RepID=UPI000345CFD8|nr:TonB-dependent receptor [Pleurocapsa sp. PCC 7319]